MLDSEDNLNSNYKKKANELGIKRTVSIIEGPKEENTNIVNLENLNLNKFRFSSKKQP